MTYVVSLTSQAEKDLRKLPKAVAERVAKALRALAEAPRPSGVKKLQAVDNAYRIRIGDYRIVYEIIDQQVTVIVIKIGHRREVYRG